MRLAAVLSAPLGQHGGDGRVPLSIGILGVRGDGPMFEAVADTSGSSGPSVPVPPASVL